MSGEDLGGAKHTGKNTHTLTLTDSQIALKRKTPILNCCDCHALGYLRFIRGCLPPFNHQSACGCVSAFVCLYLYSRVRACVCVQALTNVIIKVCNQWPVQSAAGSDQSHSPGPHKPAQQCPGVYACGCVCACACACEGLLLSHNREQEFKFKSK